MAERPVDPGYGDPDAPLGTTEWAKSWRLGFQHVAKRLPEAPEASAQFYEIGEQYRAWTLLTDRKGDYYPDFDSFCRDADPYGLEMDPARFRAYLAAELGEKTADLITVSPDQRAGRSHDEQGRFVGVDHSGNDCRNGASQSERKDGLLRAILRAPELVQQLYRDGLISQTVAARMGPRAPTPEKAAQIAAARQDLERMDRTGTPRQVMARAKQIVQRHLNLPPETPLAKLEKVWTRTPESDRIAYFAHMDEGEWTAFVALVEAQRLAQKEE